MEVIGNQAFINGIAPGPGFEIPADALAVYAAIDTENDLPGGIRELRNDERIGFIHARFATSTGKSVVGKINSLI